MTKKAAAEKLVAALTRSRMAVYAGWRAQTTSEIACRWLHRRRRTAGAIPGKEIIAVLAVSRAYDRAAGNR